MNDSQINDILDGVAFLEYFGDIYEYIGTDNGMYVFQSVNDDSHIKVGYISLIINKYKEYDIRYGGTNRK